MTPIAHDVYGSDMDHCPEISHRKPYEVEIAEELVTPIPATHLSEGHINTESLEKLTHSIFPKQKESLVEPSSISGKDEAHSLKLSNIEIFDIDSFIDHETVKSFSNVATLLAKDQARMISAEVRKGLDDNQLDEAGKIWSDQTILPLVYFIILRTPTALIMQRTMKMVAVYIAAYHREFLMNPASIDFKKLGNFLVWITEVIYLMVDPLIVSRLSEEEEQQQAILKGNKPNQHPFSRVFLSLHDPKYYHYTFIQSNRKVRVDATERLLWTWKQDVDAGYGNSVARRDGELGLWKHWKQKSENIGALGQQNHLEFPLEEDTLLLLEHLPVLSVQGTSKRPLKIEGVYKFSMGLDYFIRRYTPAHAAQENGDSVKYLSEFLNLNESESKFRNFWASFEKVTGKPMRNDKMSKRKRFTPDQENLTDDLDHSLSQETISTSKRKQNIVESTTGQSLISISGDNVNGHHASSLEKSEAVDFIIDHEPIEIYKDAARILAKYHTMSIFAEIDKLKIDHNQLNQARDIWSNQTILPFIYFVILSNPSVGMMRKAIRISTMIIAAYHSEFLMNPATINHEDLAKFLMWHTDVFASLLSPLVDLPEQEDVHQVDLVGNKKSLDTLARIFLSLHDHEIYLVTFMHGCKKKLQSFVRRHLSNWKRDVSRGYGTVISDKNGRFSLWERWNSQATRIIDFAQQTEHPESNQSLHSSQRYLSLTTSDWDFVPMKRSGKRQTQAFDDLPLLHIRAPLQLQKPLSRESAYLYSLQLDYVLDARRHQKGDAMTSAKRLPTFLRLKQSNTDFREIQSLMIHRHNQKANHQKSKPKK